MQNQENDQRNASENEPQLNPYHTDTSPGVNDHEFWTEAPGYSTAGAGESGMEGRPASVISPTGTGAPGDAGGPDLSGLPPSGPIAAPRNPLPYEQVDGYVPDGGLGGADAVGTGTMAGKELGQTANPRLNPTSGMPNRADLTEEANRDDQAGIPASFGTGSSGEAIDTEALAGVPDTGIEGNLSTRGIDERGVPGGGSGTDTPENLGMGSVEGPDMPVGD